MGWILAGMIVSENKMEVIVSWWGLVMIKTLARDNRGSTAGFLRFPFTHHFKGFLKIIS